MSQSKHSNLSTKTMLIDFTVSRWTARKKDQEISDEIAKQKNTTNKAGNYRKNLLPFAAPSYEAISTLVNQARKFHRENTLPWADGDLRILPLANFEPYMAKMRSFHAEFDAAVDIFVPDAVEPETGLFARAETELNGMFKVEDYPSASKLRQRHSFSVKRFPMPDADDFRVALNDQDVELIREEITTSVTQAALVAVRDIWNQLHTAVNHFAEVMEDGKITSALFDNLTELTELLPRLNLDDDPNFTRLANEANQKLAALSPKYVRNNRGGRRKVAEDAKRIAQSIAQFMPKES